MQDERTGLRFAAIMFVCVAAFLAVMTLVAYWQTTQVALLVAQSDSATLDDAQLWLVPILLGGGAFVVLAVAIGFWRAAANATASLPYVASTSYQSPNQLPPSQATFQPSFNGELDPNVLLEIKQHIVQDRIIQAVKLYRQATGVGLKEARDAVLLIKAQM